MRNLLFPCAIVAALLLTAAPPAGAQSFTGLRVEATIGYDRLDDEADLPAHLGTPGTLDGLHVGGGVGYDLAPTPALVVGLEANAGWTAGSVTARVPQNASAKLEFGQDLDLMLRVGVRVGSSALGFIKAGYANSRFDFHYASRQTGFSYQSSDVVDGWRAGAGVEKILSRWTYVKGEYRYTGYRDEAYNDNARHQLLLGAGLRF